MTCGYRTPNLARTRPIASIIAMSPAMIRTSATASAALPAPARRFDFVVAFSLPPPRSHLSFVKFGHSLADFGQTCQCSAGDECETPCSVGCSLTTDETTSFSGLTTGYAAALDTAEEAVETGHMSMTSSDLELMKDHDREQVVAIRFGPVGIPAGSKIYSASIEFTIDEVKSPEGDLVSKNVEFCIKNEELCITNKGLCIKNEGLCIKNEELCIKNEELCRLGPAPIPDGREVDFDEFL